MNQLLYNLLPMQPDPPPIDDLFDVEPNAELVEGASPLLGIGISFGLAALVIIGMFLLIWGLIAFFAGGDNPAKRKAGGTKVLFGAGALITAFYGWRVLGNLISDSLNGL